MVRKKKISKDSVKHYAKEILDSTTVISAVILIFNFKKYFRVKMFHKILILKFKNYEVTKLQFDKGKDSYWIVYVNREKVVWWKKLNKNIQKKSKKNNIL